MLTIGDVIKLKKNSAGKICNIQFVWDFDEGVRRYTEKLTAGGFVRNGDEVFDGGAVYGYNERAERATFASGYSYKLSRAENVYVIDSTGRNVIVRNGSSSNYKYYEDLYESTNKVEIRVDGDLKATVNPREADEFAGYTDNVYVRQYEGRIKDVVIVKGPNNVRTKVTGTAPGFTVTFDLNGGWRPAPSTQDVKKGEKAVKPDDPASSSGKRFKFWSVDGTTEYDFDTPVTNNITLYAIYEDYAYAIN